MKSIYSGSILAVTLMLSVSCSEDINPLNTAETTDVNFETSVESTFEDIDGLLSSVSFAGDANFSSRLEGLDDRFCSSTVVSLRNKVKSNADTLTINFGSEGCTDPKGNVRKGMIIMTFVGDKKLGHTTTFQDFYMNAKKIEGTRTIELTKLVPPTFSILLEGGKVTWPDGTYATREASHTRVWIPDFQVPSNSTYTIKQGGTASGLKRDGKEYATEVTKDLIFKRSCMDPPLKISMPVEGTKVFTVTTPTGVEKVMTVDFGSGACDKVITVTIDGQSKEITVGQD